MVPTKTENLDKLITIFHSIRSRFEYVPDKILWHSKDHWEAYGQIPDQGVIKGDCDCFAMACRKECRKQSIPSRLVFCMVPAAEGRQGHLVLESGGYILDNRQERVMSNIELSDYEWIEISGFEKADPWHIISNL